MSGRRERSASVAGWLRFATEMVLLPVRLLGLGLELVARTAKEVQLLGERGAEAAGGRRDLAGPLPGGSLGSLTLPVVADLPTAGAVSTAAVGAVGAAASVAETLNRKEKDMSCDQDLSGTDLKVVQYTIVSVNPYTEDGERIIAGPDTVATSDDMNPTDFTAWVIALYIQRYPERIPHRDKQYLRVCYCVQCRLTVPDADYDKQQVDALRDINRTLQRKLPNEREEEGGNYPAKSR